MRTTLALFLLIMAALAPTGWSQREQMFGRTMIFTQAQLKYSLQHGSYFTHWVDWPLGMDSSLREDGVSFRGLQYPDYQKIQDNVKLYDLDGIIFWQAHVRFGWCSDIIGFTRRSQRQDFRLIPNLSSTFDPDLDGPPILQSPDFLRLDGKVVAILYGGGKPERVQALRTKFPGRFLYLGQGRLRWDHLHKVNRGEPLSLEETAAIQETIREQLRLHDGFGWDDLCIWAKLEHGKKRFAVEYHRELTRLAAEVLREPAFAGKIFLGEAICGHENPSAHGCILSSDGTRTLRRSLQNNLDFQVDLINIPEWDEQNENTSLRPTVFNSYAHARILRHVMRRQKKQPPYHLPGDDLAQPPLILSMRKILTLGEKAEFELLHVPDDDSPLAYSASLTVKSLSGRTLRQFPTVLFQGHELQEHRLELPTEDFPMERVLIPELTVVYRNQTFRYAEGLPVIQIQPTWNFDYKWVKQPLRDLLRDPVVDFQVAPSAENDGLLDVTAAVTAPEPLAFAEVLDNWDCVYSASDPRLFPWRENQDFYVFRIKYQAVRPQTTFSGTLLIEGAEPVFLAPQNGQNAGLTNPVRFVNTSASIWHRGFHVAIPRAQAEHAVFVLDLPGLFTANIPVPELLARQTIALGGQDGLNIVLQRELRQWSHPDRLNQRHVRLQAQIAPDHNVSVMQLQLVSASGKTWRSRPRLSHPAGQETAPVTVMSETLGRPVTVLAPKATVPDLSYHWEQGGGLVASTDAGRCFYAMRGGYHDLACFRGCGGDQSGDGIAPTHRHAGAFWPEPGDLAPSVTQDEHGQSVLNFNGKGQFVALPQGVIPRRSAFRIAFEIMPMDTTRRQTLLVCRRDIAGSLSEFHLEKNVLTAKYVNDKIQSPGLTTSTPVPAGQWSQIMLDYDLSHLVITINGVASTPVSVPGPGLYDHPAFLGGWKDAWFEGKIRNLRITHQTPPQPPK